MLKPNFSQIRYSNDDDINEILKWLKEQDNKGIHDTFHCNRNLTVEEHKKGKLAVYIDPDSNLVVAYQWGGLISPGILEVNEKYRGKGIGRMLVDFRIQEALENDEPVLRIECTPETSVPFWKHMGFQTYGLGNKYAFKLLKKTHTLPKKGHSCNVKISFFNESKKWDPTIEPNKSFNLTAILLPERVVCLSKRVSYFHIKGQSFNDPVLSITIDDEKIYLNKAKYEKAERLGVKTDGKVVYIDQIRLFD